MAVQTSVTAAPTVGLNGQVASTSGAEFASRLCEGAVPVAALVVKGTADTQARVPGAATEFDGTGGSALGLAVLDPFRTSAAWTDEEAMKIITRGEIFVSLVNASVAGTDVFVGAATGVLDGTTGTKLPNAVFTTTGTGVQIVKIGDTLSA